MLNKSKNTNAATALSRSRREVPNTLAVSPAGAQIEVRRLQNIVGQVAIRRTSIRSRSGMTADLPGTASEQDAQPPLRGGLSPSALRRVRDYVETNLEFKIEIADLAAIANLSRCHFAFAFKQSVGFAPCGYVRSRRLEQARKLLSQTVFPIVEIALSTGFADQSHFSRCFRASYGVSPLTFRRSRAEQTDDQASERSAPLVASRDCQTVRGRNVLQAENMRAEDGGRPMKASRKRGEFLLANVAENASRIAGKNQMR